MLSYYSKFRPSLLLTLHPLYLLLRKDTPWVWGAAQEKAFAASKELLISSNCLMHFNSSLPLTLACDGSSYGFGAVLSQNVHTGLRGRSRIYASRTLNSAERNYSQLKKELSCIFGIKWFHDYLFGYHFELVTDHKPLLGLLKED